MDEGSECSDRWVEWEEDSKRGTDGQMDRWIDRWMYTGAEKKEQVQKEIEKDCN